MGSVLFRLLVAIALRAGLNPNDLKLVTARLRLRRAGRCPGWLGRLMRRRGYPRVMLEVRAIMSRRSTPDTANEVRALRGRRPDDRRRLVRHRHRHQRVGEVDAAQRRRRRVCRRRGHDPPGWPRHHALARAPARGAHRPRLSEPVQRHRAGDVRSPRTWRWRRGAGVGAGSAGR